MLLINKIQATNFKTSQRVLIKLATISLAISTSIKIVIFHKVRINLPPQCNSNFHLTKAIQTLKTNNSNNSCRISLPLNNNRFNRINSFKKSFKCHLSKIILGLINSLMANFNNNKLIKIKMFKINSKSNKLLIRFKLKKQKLTNSIPRVIL